MKTVQGPIEITTDQGLPYGDMPSSMLTSRFEETYIGDETGKYDNYARNTLTDWTADKNLFEHEEARGGVDRRAGYLNLIHTGDRSGIDPALTYRPEYFDGFLGPEDRDPRGINTDPDMKQLVRQEQARMRFVRFSAENYDQITGGGRSEFQTMADQQKLFRVTRDRLKVFDRQLDGRREGLRRTYQNESACKKQVLVQAYGDYIKDYALNPQRRAVVISRQILRDTRAMRDNSTDTDFAFAKYTQLRRAKYTMGTKSRVDDTAADAKAGPTAEDTGKNYKAAGILMANIIQAKRSAKESMRGDIDMRASNTAAVRKATPFHRDLTAILRSMSIDGDFAISEKTQFGKTPTPKVMDHLARQVVFNHMIPAHHMLNAEVIYKSVKPGADTRKIKDLVVYDDKCGKLREELTVKGKQAHGRMVTGAKIGTLQHEETDRGKDRARVIKYSVICQRRDNVLKYAVDDLTADADLTQHRRQGKAGYRNPHTGDQHADMKYGANDAVSMGAGKLGSKYMNRFVDRDGSVGEIAADA